MTGLAEIDASLAPHHLEVMGGFHPGPGDGAPGWMSDPPDDRPVRAGVLGPCHPPSRNSRTAGPIRSTAGSRRVIGRMACDLRGKALFPFGGPPWQPFISWAQRTGRAHVSPVTLLVHDRAGLMVSFRGALALRDLLDLPPAPPQPCEGCARPCETRLPGRRARRGRL